MVPAVREQPLVAEAKECTTVDDLSDELVLAILSQVPAGHRRRVAPLVSRRWAAVAGGPSPLWRACLVDVAQERAHGKGAPFRWASLRRWYERRAACVTRLALQNDQPGRQDAQLEQLQRRRLPDQDADAAAALPLAWLGDAAAAGGAPLVALRLDKLHRGHFEPGLSQLGLLTNLRSLYIGGIRWRMPFAELDVLSSLARLEDLSVVADGMATLEQLQGSFPEGLTELTGLTRLTLSDAARRLLSRAISLPEGLGALVNLRELHLSGFVRALPDSLGGLTGLATLALPGNFLTELPASAAELTALTRLDLSDNCLSLFPAAIEGLTALAELRLGMNYLEVLPPGPYLQHLQYLDLEWNKLGDVAGPLAGAAALRALRLTGNPELMLGEPAAQVLMGLPHLEGLYLTIDAAGEEVDWHFRGHSSELRTVWHLLRALALRHPHSMVLDAGWPDGGHASAGAAAVGVAA